MKATALLIGFLLAIIVLRFCWWAVDNLFDLIIK